MQRYEIFGRFASFWGVFLFATGRCAVGRFAVVRLRLENARGASCRTFAMLTIERAEPYRTLIAFATERFAVDRSFHSL